MSRIQEKYNILKYEVNRFDMYSDLRSQLTAIGNIEFVLNRLKNEIKRELYKNNEE